MRLKKLTFSLLFFFSVFFLYACNNNYVFMFQSNGGTTVSSLLLSQGDTVEQPIPPTKAGYFFDGWYEDDTTFAIPYMFPGSMPNHNVTVYAKWSCCNNQANAPDLADGLSPVYWDNDKNLITYENPQFHETLWYDYTDTTSLSNTSKWANAQSQDGSFWVWIPRFVYRIAYNWHFPQKGHIDICFVVGNDDTTAGVSLNNLGDATDSDMKWTSHPAFTFGDYELNGIWVAKFEISKIENRLQSIPGVYSERVNFHEAMNWSYEMTQPSNIYGFNHNEVDTHLIKQEEWGAIAYFSHSVFGRNRDEISINPNDVHTGGSDINGWITNGDQSTTGNVYGVFDMSGGKAEYVSAFTNDANVAGIELCNLPSSPYCTIYDPNVQNTLQHKGDAIYETSDFNDINASWFGQKNSFPTVNQPFFIRGGSYHLSSNPGIFAYDKTEDAHNATFRPVLIVYPKETINKVIITFHSLGVDIYSSNVAPGSTIIAPTSITNPDPNCLFDNWYYDSSYTSLATLPFVMPQHDVTLYAKWSCPCRCNCPNEPELFTGMNPMYIDSNGSEIYKFVDVSAQTINLAWVESEWYNYLDASQTGMQHQSKWANAVSLDGSYWVWIPRFVYKFNSGWHESIAGEIDICFVNGTNDYDTGLTLVNTGMASDSNGNWTSHPAFTFGTNELTGFWFAKFEASNHNGEILIRHGFESWRSIPLNQAFTLSREMENKTSLYGWLSTEVDTHQTKNEEWGAVAYLAHSKFGLNGQEIGHHGNGYWTGGGQSYAYITNGHLSTTGNASGVYDMRGGGMELVAAYVADANITNNDCVNAGIPYCTPYYDAHMWGINSKGDALYETSAGINQYNGWFGSYTFWPWHTNPWFHRGGHYSSNTSSGLFFYDGNYQYAYPQPDHYDRFTFRPVLIKK